MHFEGEYFTMNNIVWIDLWTHTNEEIALKRESNSFLFKFNVNKQIYTPVLFVRDFLFFLHRIILIAIYWCDLIVAFILYVRVLYIRGTILKGEKFNIRKLTLCLCVQVNVNEMISRWHVHSSLGQSTFSRLKVVGHKKENKNYKSLGKKQQPTKQLIRNAIAIQSRAKCRWPNNVCTRELGEVFCGLLCKSNFQNKSEKNVSKKEQCMTN